MYSKTKLALAAALVFGFAAAATAEDAAPDWVRGYQQAEPLQTRGNFMRPAPQTETSWFERASNVPV